MKVKVTKKEVKENYYNIITIGYCEAQYMLHHLEPNFYSCGIYGWACDYYIINNNTIICTGYAPIDALRNYKLVKKYEDKAEKIQHTGRNWDDTKRKLEKNLNNFIKEFLKEAGR